MHKACSPADVLRDFGAVMVNMRGSTAAVLGFNTAHEAQEAIAAYHDTMYQGKRISVAWPTENTADDQS